MKTALLLLLLYGHSLAQVIISEVLSNEPEGRVRLEWIEVFNSSDTLIDLEYYTLVAGSDISHFPHGAVVPEGSYAILARQLLPEDGSDSFEGHWGDSSGIWGDHDLENYPAFDATMALANNSGFVAIADMYGDELDRFSWHSASSDGRSVERNDVISPSSGWHDCDDLSGSTPGRANSPIPPAQPVQFSMTIEPRLISISGSRWEDQLQIFYTIPPGTQMKVDIFDDTGYQVKMLLEKSETASGIIIWDGHGRGGGRLAPGVYLVVSTLSGQLSLTKSIPVVIAP